MQKAPAAVPNFMRSPALVLVAVMGAIFVASMSAGICGGLYGAGEGASEEQEIQWVKSYKQGQDLAQSLNRPLIVNFGADWCVACDEFDAQVFQHPMIRERMEQEFVTVAIDVDNPVAGSEDAVRRFEVAGLPRVAFETPEGLFLRELSFEGAMEVEDFHRRLEQVLSVADAEVR